MPHIYTKDSNDNDAGRVVEGDRDVNVQSRYVVSALVGTKDTTTYAAIDGWTEVEFFATPAIAALPDDIVLLALINIDTTTEDAIFNGGVITDVIANTPVHKIPIGVPWTIPILNEDLLRLSIIEGRIASAASGINVQVTLKQGEYNG